MKAVPTPESDLQAFGASQQDETDFNSMLLQIGGVEPVLIQGIIAPQELTAAQDLPEDVATVVHAVPGELDDPPDSVAEKPVAAPVVVYPWPVPLTLPTATGAEDSMMPPEGGTLKTPMSVAPTPQVMPASSVEGFPFTINPPRSSEPLTTTPQAEMNPPSPQIAPRFFPHLTPQKTPESPTSSNGIQSAVDPTVEIRGDDQPRTTPPAVAESSRVDLAVKGAQQQDGMDSRILLATALDSSIESTPIRTSSSVGTTLGDASQLDTTQAESDPSKEVRETRILKSMTTLANRQGGVARIQLDPPGLGILTIQLSVQEGAVVFTLEASSTAGADALIRDLASLRVGIESRGLHVDRLTMIGPQGVQDIIMIESEEAENDNEHAEEEETRQRHQHRRSAPRQNSENGDWFFEDMLELDQQQSDTTLSGGQIP